MQYFRIILNLLIFSLITLSSQSQDILIYENSIDLKNTKNLPEGDLLIYIPKKDSLQAFDFYEYSLKPDTIIVDGNNNSIAKWKSSSISGIENINIKALGFLSYRPSSLRNLARDYQAYLIRNIDNISNSTPKNRDAAKWISLKIPGSEWIVVKQKNTEASNFESRTKYDLFKLCDKCGSEVKFISPHKNRFRARSSFNTAYHWHDLYIAGAEAYKSYDLDKALLIFNEAILLAPSYYPSYAIRGVACARLGRFDEAQMSLQQAMRKINTSKSKKDQVKDKSYIFYAFANVYALQNKKEQAVNFLKKSIEFDKTLSFKLVSNDQDLINLAEYKPFQSVLEELRLSKK